MKNIHILGTGLQGLVGSRITELLGETYTFSNISRSTGVDITQRAQVFAALKKSDAQIVIHLAAKADVDGCEKDKELGETGEAWKINVFGTQHLVEACKETGKKLVYISTDFVFDGEKGDYTEEDTPRPINWYGVTKYKAEELVRLSGIPFVIIRPAYPYGRAYEKKKDFVQAIVSRLKEGKAVYGITDHLFVPTYLDDFVYALEAVITNQAEGIFHVVGSQSLTPYDSSQIIAKRFGYDQNLVQKTTRAEFFSGRALRPYNLSLKNDRIKKLGVRMRPFEEGLAEIVTP